MKQMDLSLVPRTQTQLSAVFMLPRDWEKVGALQLGEAVPFRWGDRAQRAIRSLWRLLRRKEMRCAGCGSELPLTKGNSTKRRFCSVDCQGRSYRRNHPRLAPPRTCRNCGSKFKVTGPNQGACGATCADAMKVAMRRTTAASTAQWLSSLRGRAKRRGLPFNLTASDLIVPERCPVLGTPLLLRNGRSARPGATRHSPSVDRIVPELGYVKGNIVIISHRANSIRRDANATELRAVLRYVARLERWLASTTTHRRRRKSG